MTGFARCCRSRSRITRCTPGHSEPAAFIAGPVFNSQGRIIGFVALELCNPHVFRVFNDYNGLGATGEAMVAMRRGEELHVCCPAASLCQDVGFQVPGADRRV